MSAQGGVWNRDGSSVDGGLLDEVALVLKSSGPDSECRWADKDIGIVYFPFHSTSESKREKQPYVTRRGSVVTWDGRLDNREELITELKDAIEPNPTDVALAGAAFDRWEADSFRRIIGDWALSIWLPASRELVFAVDYMAIRHIYYLVKEPVVVWSTHIDPLVLSSRSKLHIDDEYIAGYFAHEPEAHITPYREIRQVPANHMVRISPTGSCFPGLSKI